MNSSHSDSFAEDQAALWAAKLDGDSLTSSDRQALEAWLASDPRHRSLLSQYCQFSADLEQHLPALVFSGGVRMPPAQPRSSHAIAKRVLWFSGALAAAAAIAVVAWPRHPAFQNDTVATSVAERKTLKLADGSIVELNARTNLLVELGAHERHVRMADGEAFFTVAKDKSRPFIVETPAGSVRVTGTVFDVHAETSTDIAVTVVEGSVQVTPCQLTGRNSGTLALTANDQLIATADQSPSVRKLSRSELEDALAWRRGEVVFDGTRLGAALAQFARYHGRTIHVTAEAAKLSVGGRYNLDNLEGFLNDIQSFLPVQVSRDQSSGAITVALRAKE